MMNNELTHYGVKGMHWGIRNEETKARYARGSIKGRALRKLADKTEGKVSKKTSDSVRRRAKAADVKKNRKKASRRWNSSTMSSKELDARIARLSKEKKLRELTESEVTPGRAEAKRILKDVGKTVVTSIGTATATYVAARTIQGKPIVPDELREWVGKKMLKKVKK